MKKIFIDDIELLVDGYERDHIRSEYTNNKLIRIKCETKVKGIDNSKKLKGVLGNKNFTVKIPDEKLEFEARQGEISYDYSDGNVFKDKNVDIIHILEIIEFEEEAEEIKAQMKAEDSRVEKLEKKIVILEKLLVDKKIIDREEIKRLSDLMTEI